MNRQSILPILFGISLTTFGLSVAILLFNMLEKDDDDDVDRKKYNRIAKSKCKEVSVQLRIPEKYAPAVIGKGGSVIKNIQELTNTYIKMEKGIVYSTERVCHIWSDNMENIKSAQSMIQNIVEHQPSIETFELFLPFDASRRVFQSPYGFVQKIQKTYGVKVTVERNAHETEIGLKRKVIVKGTADQIAPAVIEIEDRIQEEVEAQGQIKMYFLSGRTLVYHRDPDTEDTIENPDSDIYDYLLPYEACREIIEKDGCAVQEIEKSSGAKIIIGDEAIAEYEGKNRKLAIRGTDKQVKLAASLIESKIREAHESQIDSNCDDAIKGTSESSCNNNSSTSKHIHIVLNPALKDSLMGVYVSASKSPNLFWIHVISRANVELHQLVYEMTEYYNNKENHKLHVLKKITKGQMVAVRHMVHSAQWYRAEIMSVLNSPAYEVFLVDYGYVKIVDEDDILELRTDMLSLRQQAVECSLANVKPRGDKWTSEACNKFAEFVHLGKWVPLVAKVRGYKERLVEREEPHRKGSVIPCIDLYDETSMASNKNIGDNLIEMGLADIEEEVYSEVSFTLPHHCNSPLVPSDLE